MLDYKRILALLVVSCGAVFLITIALSDQQLYIGVDLGHSAKLYIAQEVNQDYEALSKEDFLLMLAENPQTIIKTPKVLTGSQIKAFISSIKYNPFALLDAYPDPTPYVKNPQYNKTHYALINDDDYCDKVDLYNLKHPENMFNKKNFFTDSKKTSVLKSRVISKIGKAYLNGIDKTMSKKLSETPLYHLDKKITTFHLTLFHFLKHHQMGKHYLCETQMLNHIMNTTDLTNKAYFVQRVKDYSLAYKDKPQCFDKTNFFPTTYRLYDKKECEEFFNIINSKKYNESLKTEPIQYVLKIGGSAHRAEGVFLLDKNETKTLHADYDSGKNCGKVDKFLIAQKYISNPLLLDNHNKFHMRVYLLIASANPFIVFFQDGYIRASIFPFDKFSEDRATHLTNLLAKDIAEARKDNKKYHGMTPEEIDDYQIWTLEDLQSYLLEIGKITDLNWLDNYLRPALQKSFMHLVRMTGDSFWKQSNTYEMLGCDFMLDDNLGLWFIEANLSPQLDVSDPNIVARMLEDMFEIQYSYYRSRMKRVLDVIHRMKREDISDVVKNLDKWKKLYQGALKNRLEPEYKIKTTNSFKLVMDESLPGTKAYLDNLPEECLKN